MRRVIHRLRHSGLPVFTREIISNFNSMGAVLPSSKRLARGMAAKIPQHSQGLIIELGAGTGVVTQAMLERQIDPQRLIIIERSPKLVQHLKKRFGQLNIIEGDAARLSDIVSEYSQPIDCIISSLPLRSLPKNQVVKISAELTKVLPPKASLIQFTYSLKQTHGHSIKGLTRTYSKRIWFNIPPARIEMFSYGTR